MSVAIAPAPSPRAELPVRVMIVDDAVVVRGLIVRWLTEAGGCEIVGTHRSGRSAVDDMERADPDLVILDIEMPEMDGIEALPLILKKKRDCVVVMASTLTRRNAEISLKCLSLGAVDYIPKPESNRDLSTSLDFRREIVEKVRTLGRRAVQRRTGQPRTDFAPSRPAIERTPFRAAQQAAPAGGGFLAKSRAAQESRPAPETRAAPETRGGHERHAGERTSDRTGAVALRPFSAAVPRLLVIGSSTGGPQALNTLVAGLIPLIDRVPVLITQHMPATFTTILAEHLGRSAGKPSAEAVHGEPIRPGRIYVAPGGRHMVVRAVDGHGAIALDDGPMVNFCKPAVDPLFASAAQVFGSSVLALVLTGMGSDGTVGGGAVVAAGGSVIAQDEATSVVWGMPGSIAHAGHCSAVLPLRDIAPKVLRLFAGDRS